MIYTALLISFASLGFRCITSKDMIFYFLRKWIDDLRKKVKDNDFTKGHIEEEILWSEHNIKEADEMTGVGMPKDEYIKKQEERLKKEKLNLKAVKGYEYFSSIIYIMKPIILCATCMSSIHTMIWWPYLVGSYSIDTILVILMVAFMNTILFGLIELIKKQL